MIKYHSHEAYIPRVHPLLVELQIVLPLSVILVMVLFIDCPLASRELV